MGAPLTVAWVAYTVGTVRSTYGFPGAERDLQDQGLINSGFLGPFKARILLHLLVAGGATQDEIVTAFDAAGGHVAVSG